jgi:hypothetical protein
MNTLIRCLSFFIILILPCPTFSQEGPLPNVEMRISMVPEITIIDGKPTVYYELWMNNFTSDSLKLKKFELVNTANLIPVVSLTENLEARIRRIGISSKGSEAILPPGGLHVLYLEFVLEGDRSTEFTHRLEFEVVRGNAKTVSFIQRESFHLSNRPTLVLGAPLNAGLWAAVYEPSWERGHRRVLYTVDEKRRIPGRFAIDFIRLNNEGKYADGTDDEIKNWYGYGANVLAVSDGVIASTRDDFMESQTLSAHPAHPADKATGNYVSMDIGNERIVFYEHLKPGSIKVKPGQKVKKGEVIASVGFTGQTTGPHLHFHVADKNSPLGAEGVPFVFESFIALGSYADMAKFGKEIWEPAKNSRQLIRAERPGANTVIQFSVR